MDNSRRRQRASAAANPTQPAVAASAERAPSHPLDVAKKYLIALIVVGVFIQGLEQLWMLLAGVVRSSHSDASSAAVDHATLPLFFGIVGSVMLLVVIAFFSVRGVYKLRTRRAASPANSDS